MSFDGSTTRPAVTTLAQRKSAEGERRRRAADAVVDELRAYAHREKGGFVVFGSYVNGGLRFDSDLDLMVDFPPDRAGAAWRFVEDVCDRHGLTPDIHDAATGRDAFAARVRANGISLS